MTFSSKKVYDTCLKTYVAYIYICNIYICIYICIYIYIYLTGWRKTLISDYSFILLMESSGIQIILLRSENNKNTH